MSVEPMSKRQTPTILRRVSESGESSGPVWLRLKSAAVLVDLSPGALKQHLYRRNPPEGVVRKFGRAILIHRERFLQWIESGGA